MLPDQRKNVATAKKTIIISIFIVVFESQAFKLFPENISIYPVNSIHPVLRYIEVFGNSYPKRKKMDLSVNMKICPF